MRVRIAEREWYPVLEISEGNDYWDEYELTEEQISQVERAFEAFEEAQDILAKAQRIEPPPQEPGPFALSGALYDGLPLYATTAAFPFEFKPSPAWPQS